MAEEADIRTDGGEDDGESKKEAEEKAAAHEGSSNSASNREGQWWISTFDVEGMGEGKEEEYEKEWDGKEATEEHVVSCTSPFSSCGGRTKEEEEDERPSRVSFQSVMESNKKEEIRGAMTGDHDHKKEEEKGEEDNEAISSSSFVKDRDIRAGG